MIDNGKTVDDETGFGYVPAVDTDFDSSGIPVHEEFVPLHGTWKGRVFAADESPQNQTGRITVEAGWTMLHAMSEIQEVLNGSTTDISQSNLIEAAVQFREDVRSLDPQNRTPYWPRFDGVFEEFSNDMAAGRFGQSNYDVDLSRRFANGEPLLQITREMVDGNATAHDYLRLFLETSYRVRTRLATSLHAQEDAVSTYLDQVHPADTATRRQKSNARRLLENRSNNYLRVVGVLNPEPYNVVHSNEYYRFSSADEPNHFAKFLIGREEDPDNKERVYGKRMLSLGPGNGRDEVAYARAGATSIDVIEGSTVMLERLKKRKEELATEGLGDVLKVPDAPQEMFRALQHMCQGPGKQYDTITGVSSVHYNDDDWFLYLLLLLRHQLKDDGMLALCTKAPGSTQFDTPEAGFSIIDDSEIKGDTPGEVEEEVRLRLRMNLDAQTRAFRSKEHLRALIQRADYKVVIKEHDLGGYENENQPPQRYYYAFCTKNQ